VIDNNTGDDGGHGLPAATQQPGHHRLVGALRQPGNDVFEVAGVTGSGTSPRHLLGAHSPAASTVQATDLRLHEQLHGAEVQVPPPTCGAVIDSPAAPAARAHRSTSPATQPDDHSDRAERHRRHRGPDDPQHLVECSRDAHVSAPRRFGCVEAPKPTKRRVRVARPHPPQRVGPPCGRDHSHYCWRLPQHGRRQGFASPASGRP
jgi:hypothetical protein